MEDTRKRSTPLPTAQPARSPDWHPANRFAKSLRELSALRPVCRQLGSDAVLELLPGCRLYTNGGPEHLPPFLDVWFRSRAIAHDLGARWPYVLVMSAHPEGPSAILVAALWPDIEVVIVDVEQLIAAHVTGIGVKDITYARPCRTRCAPPDRLVRDSGWCS